MAVEEDLEGTDETLADVVPQHARGQLEGNYESKDSKSSDQGSTAV